MKHALVLLPGRTDMLRVLTSVDTKEELQKFFYPAILKYSGVEVDEQGMNKMVGDSIHEYQKNILSFSSIFMWFRMNRFVDALVAASKIRVVE